MTDFLNPLGGRFIGPSGPVAPSAVAGTVPDPPRGLLQVDPGTIIKGIVIGRESDGLTAIATDKGTVRVASNASLPSGTHVTLEVRPTGDRLQVLILASDAAQAPTPSTQAQPNQASDVQPTTSRLVPAASSNTVQPQSTTSTPASATQPPIRIVGTTLPAIVLQPQPSLPQPSLPQQPVQAPLSLASPLNAPTQSAAGQTAPAQNIPQTQPPQPSLQQPSPPQAPPAPQAPQAPQAQVPQPAPPLVLPTPQPAPGPPSPATAAPNPPAAAASAPNLPAPNPPVPNPPVPNPPVPNPPAPNLSAPNPPVPNLPAPNPPALPPASANPSTPIPVQPAQPSVPPALPVGTPPPSLPTGAPAPANAPAATNAQTIAVPPAPALPQPVQIRLPNGQVVTLAQPIPDALTAPLPAASNQALTAQPPPLPESRMPVSRPAMSAPPLTSALPQDVRQRILALFDEIPASLAAKSQIAGTTSPVNTPPRQAAANIAPAQVASALQPGAHLQIRVVAAQIGSQHAIEIDPAAHLLGGKDSQIVFGRVIAVTPAGHAVIHTPAGNILLQQKSSLPVGAQLALALDAIEAPAPAIAGPMPVQTPQQALLSLSQNWPTLADIVAILQGGAPAAARPGSVDAAVARQILAHLPQMGSKLGAGMMNAIAALRSGEIGRLMGPLFAARGLGTEREETVRRLRGEFAQLSSLAQEKPEIEWRALFLPYLDDQNRVQRINLYYRRPRSGEAGDDEKNGTRFVVEADFTRLGPLQLDGLMRQQRFDLMVRSRIRLDERMRRDIEAIYEEARGLTGFAGSIAFQTVDIFPVMPLEELKQSDERV